ncbi:hypothetical protein [Micromonospora echinofusca]|uniref:Serine/threonine protein kinase n=1 Tax=Micromonospora echinofusca TaxID=47858 RepID=A0ABS3VL09_MICEH|nr:hypothetical protein [Micromonospora echinofusca]MBO4205151.1 hypothetical protein [Micromonospora echinofusca]
MQGQPEAPPVFVDGSGRRRRLSVLAGTGIGVGLLASLGLILAGLFTGSSVPLPGWPESKPARPIEAGVDELGVSPDAAQPTPGPSSTATGAPSRTPSAPASATTRPGAAPTAQPSRTEVPGQGDTRRNEPAGKPSRSPGKPK